MPNLYSYDITFKEVPNKTSLTLAFSGCKNNCSGCHSPHLRGDEGKKLTGAYMQHLLKRYSKHVDVVTFLGGEELAVRMAPLINGRGLDVCLYTGQDEVKNKEGIRYLKLGAYKEEFGGLDSPATNQRMIDLVLNKDITGEFIDGN